MSAVILETSQQCFNEVLRLRGIVQKLLFLKVVPIDTHPRRFFLIIINVALA